jgi:hypothetical protein
VLILVSALIVAAAVIWSGARVAQAATRPGGTSSNIRTAEMLALFAPGIAAARNDPRALLVWQPLAKIARQLYPTEFTAIDAAAGSTFPFTSEQIQAAHARWSADWLAWERAHDGEYKLRAAAAHEELGERAASVYGRSRLEAIEREKLERYQQRYEEYTRVSKALQTLIAGTTRS